MSLWIPDLFFVFSLTQALWVWLFTSDLLVFDRDREDHLYAVVPWVLSELSAYLVPAILGPVVYTLIVYFMADLRPGIVNLAVCLAAVTASHFVGMGLALMSASVSRTFSTATALCVSFAAVASLLHG